MNIQSRIVLALLGVALTALLTTGGYAYWRAYSALVDAQRESIRAISASRAARIQSVHREWIRVFEELAGDPLLLNSLQLYQERSYARYRRRLSRIIGRMQARWALESVVVHQHSKRVASAGTVRSGGINIAPVFDGADAVPVAALPGDDGAQPIITIQGAVQRDDEPLGQLVIQMRARNLAELVRSPQGLGQRGSVMVVVKATDGSWQRLVATGGDSVVQAPREPGTPGAPLATHWVDGHFLQAGARSTPFMGVLVAAGDEVLAPADELGIAVGVFALIVTVLVTIVGLWLARNLTAGIRNLSEAARGIQAGDYERRARVLRDDEIGGLAHAFNAMAAALIDANARLEDRVAKRTAELATSNAALEKRAEALARSNAELEQFASVASHDLQEPLRKVQAFGDRLKERYAAELEPRAQDYIERMQQSAHRMRVLIEDLLSYSRVSTGGSNFGPVELDGVLDGVLQDLDEPIRSTGATLERSPLATVEGDRTQLRQLLQNLIGNALKYAKDDVPPHIVVRCEAGETQVHICVTDNGIGFDESYTDRIFGIFQRLHGRDKYVGTGVGLAICKRIVERHHGHISVRSAVGQGSEFCVTLPREQPSEAEQESADQGHD